MYYDWFDVDMVFKYRPDQIPGHASNNPINEDTNTGTSRVIPQMGFVVVLDMLLQPVSRRRNSAYIGMGVNLTPEDMIWGDECDMFVWLSIDDMAN